MAIPDIRSSSRKERLDYVHDTFRCRHDCEACGVCRILRGREAEAVFKQYIEGNVPFQSIASELRR